jgi:hypothetical protein
VHWYGSDLNANCIDCIAVSMKKTIEDYDVNAWREIDVYEWVKKTCEKNDADAYADLFLRNNINGETLLKLTKDDIKNIGVHSIGHIIHLYVI